MIQILGISILDDMDHFIKEELGIEKYIRYMDDFILIHPDKEYLEYCKEEIGKHISKIGLNLHPRKTKIYPLGKGIDFLWFRFQLVKSGIVVVTVLPKNVKSERKKLQRMANLVKKGEMTLEKMHECYKAWKAHASKGNPHDLMHRMDKFYRSLLEE